MQIFVRTYAGKTFTLDVEPSDTICVLRRLIDAKTRLPPGVQQLEYNRKVLGLASERWTMPVRMDDTRTLESYGIDEHATLTLLLRGTRKRELVPNEATWASKQKRRALSNAVAPHARRAERLRSERDEARAALFETQKDLGETRSALNDARTALDEARTALAAPRCSGIAAGSVANMSDTALEQLHEELLSAQAVLARDQQRRLDAERDSKLCVVCLDRPKTFMSRACNHLALCEACIPDGASPCPVCRVATSQWDRVYA